MVNLTHEGSTASVIFRLRQICELSTPYYLFQLTNKNSQSDIYFTADDISNAQGLYQEFEWRNGVNGLTAGNFIADPGEYKITIWETQYQYNLTTASASNILIYDTLRIHGTSSPTFVDDDNDITYVYDN